MSSGRSFLSTRTRQILVWGSLWGIVVTAAELSSVINGDWTWSNRNVIAEWPLPGWCAVGCLHLVVARRALRRRGWGPLIAGWLVISLSWGFLAAWIGLSAFTWFEDYPPGTLPEVVAYVMWPSLFFGGLLVAAYALLVKTEITRSLLQDAAIARSRTLALRGEAELSNYQRHVDAPLLLDVMADVERRYRSAPEQADELLGRFVEFLRCAMPGLGDRTSTLRTELQLARAFVNLQSLRHLDTGRGKDACWTIDEASDLPNLPFPAELMLPLLALATASAEPRLLLLNRSPGVQIEVRGLGRRVPEEFTQRVRASLRSLFGEAFTLHVDADRSPQLALTLGLAASMGEKT